MPARTPPQRGETCVDYLGPHALLAHAEDTIESVRHSAARLGRGGAWELVCVIDAERRLLGTLSATDLLVLPGHARVERSMRRGPFSVRPSTDPEHMASLALHHGLRAMPVTDEQGRLLGVVGSQALMGILRREHVSDLHRLAGISRESRQAVQALEEPPLRRVRHRLPWLLVGLVGSMLATLVVARFEASIAQRTALAFFVPGLVYLADAIGTQTEAVAVRGLLLSRISLRRLMLGELRGGVLIGLLLALVVFPMVWFAFADVRLAGTVAIALASASAVASLLGMLLPWALNRWGADPAYGSGPLATIIQDVLTLMIYFWCAAAIFGESLEVLAPPARGGARAALLGVLRLRGPEARPQREHCAGEPCDAEPEVRQHREQKRGLDTDQCPEHWSDEQRPGALAAGHGEHANSEDRGRAWKPERRKVRVGVA